MITKNQIKKIEQLIKNSGISLSDDHLPEWVDEVLPQMDRDENGNLREGWEEEAENIVASIACGGCH